VEFDEDDAGDDSTTIGGIDTEDEDISSARVPDPKRYTFPLHLIVDEPVNALK